jgi:hypothetical protein
MTDIDTFLKNAGVRRAALLLHRHSLKPERVTPQFHVENSCVWLHVLDAREEERLVEGCPTQSSYNLRKEDKIARGYGRAD